jgi:hypothetical protein
MTGSWLAELPALMVRPHNAQTVLPFPIFAPLPFAGRFLPFCWRGIETESDVSREVDPSILG